LRRTEPPKVAVELTTKELRLMEFARARGQAAALLLDETLAGLGHGEAEEVVAVAQRLPRDGVTIAMPAVRPSNEVRRPRSPWPATRGRLDACRTGRPGGQPAEQGP
jgi:hypothetical protein